MLKYRVLFLYFLKECMPPFLLGFLVFSLILITGNLLKILNLLLTRGVEFYDFLNLIFYLYIPLFSFVIPMAVMLSILVALGRFSADNEITAFQALGISPYSFLPPALFLGIAGLLLTALISHHLGPLSFTRVRTLTYKMIQSGLSTTLRDGTFTELVDKFTIFAGRLSEDRTNFKDVIIYDARGKINKYFAFAKEGTIKSDENGFYFIIILKDGSIQLQSESMETLKRISFDIYEMRIPVGRTHESTVDMKPLKELSTPELYSYLRKKRSEGKEDKKAVVQFNRRISFPLAALVFAFISVPLGFLSSREGKLWGFTFSIILFTIYYILLLGSESLLYRGAIPGSISAWIPNLVFLVAGLWLSKIIRRPGYFSNKG